MKPSLQTKLFVNFMLVVALILAGFAVGASALVRQYFLSAKQQELIGKGQEMSRVLDDFMTGKLTAPELVELADRIDGFLDARIWAVDASGRMIVMSSTPRRSVRDRQVSAHGVVPGSKTNSGGMRSSTAVRNLLKDIEPVFAGQTLTRTFFHPYYGEDMMIVAAPIINAGGAASGAVILNAPVQGINDFLSRVYLAIGLIGLLALALTLFIVRRLSRGIVRPLREMEETAACMAEGRYDNRVKITSQDEVGQLGQSLNTLAQELARFVERTEQMEKLRREFVANVSHELRTPLTIIRGYSEAIVDGTVVDQVQIDSFLHMVRDEAVRLERLIKSLLEMSKLQTAESGHSFTSVRLTEVIQHVQQMMLPLAEAKQIALLVETDPDLLPVAGDRDRLIQLLLILADNAVKYTPSGGAVTLSLKQTETGVVRCRVQDSGIGIPAEDLPYIWERFYKVDKSHRQDEGGAGLGLAIARQIIDLHKATVSVTSELGAGTRIDLDFK